MFYTLIWGTYMNSVRIVTILIFFILFAAIASGQSSRIDSLEALLKTYSSLDTARVNFLNKFAYEIRTQVPQKARAYARQSYELSSQLNYFQGKATSLWITGITIQSNDREAALANFREALKIAEEIDDKVGKCNYLISIGNMKKQQRDTLASDKAYEQALGIARQIKNKNLIIKAQINIAGNNIRGGNLTEAAQLLEEVIQTAKEIDYEEMLARAYASIGVVYNLQGDYPTSLKYFLSALEINEKRDDYIGIFNCLSNIASVQSEHNEFDEALETIRKAQQLSIREGDSMRISICLNCLGNLYRQMERPEALEYFQKSLLLSKFNKVAHNLSNLTSIGSIYTDRGEFEKAMTSFNEALALAQKVGMKRVVGEVNVKIGIIYLKQKKYGRAKEFIQEALLFAEEAQSVDLQKDCYEQLSEIYAATGNFKDAYMSHVQYKALSDTLFNANNTRKMALLESSYKFAREREVYELEKMGKDLKIKGQRQTILLFVVISALAFLLLFAVYWLSRLKKKVLRLEIENINRELQVNQKTAAVAKLKLVQSLERDAYNVKKLEHIEKGTVGEDQKNLRSLINNYKLQPRHSNWEEFETLFIKINTSFWNKLNESYPTLTHNERRLCVFLKLNMSNKDIAQITFQSEEALKKSRLRLRKKLGLDRDTNLITFIQNL